MDFLKHLDFRVFCVSALLLVGLSVGIFLWGNTIDVSAIKIHLTQSIGSAFLFFGLLALAFVIFIAFSRIGSILLSGDPDHDQSLSTGQWITRLFAGGIGASILFWAAAEWMFYIQTPPFGAQPMSHDAIAWASTYGFFHWGPIAWAMYLIPTIPIAYVYHVRKVPVLKLSTALMPAIGQTHANGWIGRFVDIFFIIGVVAGGAAGLGVKAPLIAEGLGWLFDFTPDSHSSILALILCAFLFLSLFWHDPSRGNARLANTAFLGTLLIFAIFLWFGPKTFLLSMGLESIGRLLDNFFTMATYTESTLAISGQQPNHFPQDWTVFYWSWWLVFSPAMGLYLAKISQGKTLRQVIFGTLVFGSLGAFSFFGIIGNFGLFLQLTSVADLVSILNNVRPTAAIFAMLEALPGTLIIVLIYVGVVIFYTASGLESFSFMLGAVSQKTVENGHVLLPIRLFWLGILLVLSSLMIGIGGIDILQLITIICAIPMLVIMVLVAWAGWRITSLDLKHYSSTQDTVITLTNFPEVDPWSSEGYAQEQFQKLCKEAARLAQEEHRLIDAMAQRKRELAQGRCDQELQNKLEKEIELLKTEFNLLGEQSVMLQYTISQMHNQYRSLRQERQAKERESLYTEVKQAYLDKLDDMSTIQNPVLQEKLANLKANEAIRNQESSSSKENKDN